MDSETVIDLRTYVEPLTEFVQASVAKFVVDKPDVPAATIGLWGDGFHGWIALHVDTPEHRDEYVAKLGEKAVSFVERDKRGLYGVNGWDFPNWLGEWSFPGWPNLYNLYPDQPTYVSLQGDPFRLDPEAGDLEKHAALFPLLVAIMKRQGDFSSLRRVAPFRAGVQTVEGSFSEYWLIDL